MTEPSDFQHRFILPEGCQVVVLREVTGQGARVVHPRGAVAIVIKSPDSEGQLSGNRRNGKRVTQAARKQCIILPSNPALCDWFASLWPGR